MKPGSKFIATYSAITFLLLLIAKLILKEVTKEIFAYTAYYYLLTLGAAIVIISTNELDVSKK